MAAARLPVRGTRRERVASAEGRVACARAVCLAPVLLIPPPPLAPPCVVVYIVYCETLSCGGEVTMDVEMGPPC